MEHNNIYDIAIIGAGASGLMLASKLDRKKYKNICIIESNSTIGAKIKVSGGAKCNITNENISYKKYLGDKEFTKEILSKFTNRDLLEFLNQNAVFPKLNPKIVKGTYFCNSSKDVISMFEKLTAGIKKYLNTKVEDLSFDKFFTIKTNKGKIEARKVIVSSGGLSFASLGASSIAYDIALKFSHTINTLNPALVGFTVQKEQFWFKALSGVSTDVNIYVGDKKIEGSLLFAHKGFSGPCVLTSSLYWKKGKLAIDFLPNKKIENYLKGNKKISTALPLPKRFMQEYLKEYNIEDKAVSSLSNSEKEILKNLKFYEFSPAGNFGYSKAEVTKGGINTDEIEVNSMQSKKQKGLFFIGECLDVTGELGGYNFQFAFSSAVVCAKALNK